MHKAKHGSRTRLNYQKGNLRQTLPMNGTQNGKGYWKDCFVSGWYLPYIFFYFNFLICLLSLFCIGFRCICHVSLLKHFSSPGLSSSIQNLGSRSTELTPCTGEIKDLYGRLGQIRNEWVKTNCNLRTSKLTAEQSQGKISNMWNFLIKELQNRYFQGMKKNTGYGYGTRFLK